VFEIMVQRRIFGHEWDDVKREWIKVLNEELNDLYFSLNIIWVMKSKVIMFALHVARIGDR